MTAKDYKLMASKIKEIETASTNANINNITTSQLYCVVEKLCEAFQEDNKRFDKKLFIEACNL